MAVSHRFSRAVPISTPFLGGAKMVLNGLKFTPGLQVKFGQDTTIITSDRQLEFFVPPATLADPVQDTQQTNNNLPITVSLQDAQNASE